MVMTITASPAALTNADISAQIDAALCAGSPTFPHLDALAPAAAGALFVRKSFQVAYAFGDLPTVCVGDTMEEALALFVEHDMLMAAAA